MSTTTIEVSVTAEDIAKGHRCSAYGCPVRVAVMRYLVDPYFCAVSPQQLVLFGKRFAMLPERIDWPTDAREWIATFDKNGHRAVEPTSFYIDLPSDSLKPELREVRA